MSKFRIGNFGAVPQHCWAPASVPFAIGELAQGDGVFVHQLGYALQPKILERWKDGTVRRGLIDVPIADIWAGVEQTYNYEKADRPPRPSYPILPTFPPGTSLSLFFNGVSCPFTNWQTTYVSSTRVELLSEIDVGGLHASLYVTIWSMQPFGRLTIVVGNDALQRTEATALPVEDLRFLVAGIEISPTFQHAHGLNPVEPFRDYRLMSGTAIGDGARWGTEFTWGIPPASPSALASASYRLRGLPEPETEDETRSYGLLGRLKGGIWPDGTAGTDDHRTRIHWEEWSAWWLTNAENSTWGRNGFWLQQEGSTGGHPDWGPATCGRDDKAMSPKGLERWLCLSLTRLRAPDHYRGLDHAISPGSQAGAFNGWVSPPLREQADYQEHVAGSNGWSGTDDAHREMGVQHRVYQLTGEEWLRRELILNGELACLRARAGFGSGEGRDVSRTLNRKLIAWLVGTRAERESFKVHLDAWGSAFHPLIPALPGSFPPVHSLAIQYPGFGKHSPGMLALNGLPPDVPYVIFPFVEPFCVAAFGAAYDLTGIGAFAVCGLKLLPELKALLDSDGRMWDILIPDGRRGMIPNSNNTIPPPRLNSWAYPSLARVRDFDPAFAAGAAAIEAVFPSSWDEEAWRQA
jgi:hypothetical protein